MKFGYSQLSGFSEEVVWNCGPTDNGACLFYKFPNRAFGSSAVKSLKFGLQHIKYFYGMWTYQNFLYKI